MITLLVVVATGNHYWLDAIVALGLLLVLHPAVPRTDRPHRDLAPELAATVHAS